MTKPVLGVLLVLCLALPRAAAAAPATDPTGKALDACLDSDRGGTTVGMVQCYGDAAAAYDKALNQTYQDLMKSLDPASRDLLRAAQRKWLDARQADAALWGGPWRKQAGTISQVEGAQFDAEALRSRLAQLQALQTATQ